MNTDELIAFLLPVGIFYGFVIPITLLDVFRLEKPIQNLLKNPQDAEKFKKWIFNNAYFIGIFVLGTFNNYFILIHFQQITIFYINTMILLWVCLTPLMPEKFGLKPYSLFHGLLATTILLGQCAYVISGTVTLVNFSTAWFLSSIGITMLYKKIKRNKSENSRVRKNLMT